MGLDMVEVVMAIEEAFDIEIPDEQCEKIRTVGQMYALVVSRLAAFEPRCPSSAVFYPTRRALMDLSGAERRSIAPATRIETLLPAGQRRALWRELTWAVEARLPDLEAPPWLRRLGGGAVLALLVAGVALCFASSLATVALYCLTGAFCVWAAGKALSPLAVVVPVECATVGGTVRTILRQKHGLTAPKPRAWDPEETWVTLQRIVAQQLNVPVEAVTAEADFVNNLGAD